MSLLLLSQPPSSKLDGDKIPVSILSSSYARKCIQSAIMSRSVEVDRGTLVESGQRFDPLTTIVSRRQAFHPTNKVRRPEPSSFRRRDVIETMGPQLVGVLLKDGQMYRVEEEGRDQIAIAGKNRLRLATFDGPETETSSGYRLHLPVTEIVAGKIIPVGPWGEDEKPDDMIMNFIPYWRSFQDAPAHIQQIHLDQRANTLAALRDTGAKVQYTGRIGSYSSWRGEDGGLQTVMLFHDQGHTLSDEFNKHGAEGIRNFREKSIWDKPFYEDEKSPSMLLCEPVAALVEHTILPKHGLDGLVHTDQRGFTVDIPGYTIDDFRRAGPWLTETFKGIQKQLAKAHGLVYASKLKDVEDFVLGEQTRGAFDVEKYHTFFQRRTNHDGSYLGMQLHALADFDLLRYGFGQVFGARFETGVGAQFEFSTVVLGDQREVGPDEMRGVRLIRPPDAVDREKVVENAIFLRKTVGS